MGCSLIGNPGGSVPGRYAARGAAERIGCRGAGRREEGDSRGMTDAERSPEVEQRLAQELEPERHRAPSEGVPRDLSEDDGEEPPST